MPSNILARNDAMYQQNDSLYGSNRITYTPNVMGLAGNTKPYNAGKLQEGKHARVTYDVAQRYPQEGIAEALKATQTELKQIHGLSSSFEYVQYAHAVELVVSNLISADKTNVQAGIINNLNMEWDAYVFHGDGIKNNGYSAHPKAYKYTAPDALSWDTLIRETNAALSRIQDTTGLTDTELSRITFAYDSSVAQLFRKFSTTGNGDVTEMEKFQKLYPGMEMVQLPSTLLTHKGFLMILREMVTLHHASIPGLYSTEEGAHGMSESSVFTYESASVELEIDGGIQETTFLS